LPKIFPNISKKRDAPKKIHHTIQETTANGIKFFEDRSLLKNGRY